MPILRLDLRQLAFLLARTVDLVGVDDAHHGRRVGMTAVEIARQLGWPDAEQRLLYDAGLLHDCGVSTTREHRRLVDVFEWAGAQAHCILGAERMLAFPPLAHLAPLVRWHHTPWTELPSTACDPRTALQANLLFLSDRVDALCAAHPDAPSLLAHAEGIRDRVRRNRGRLFAPELVEGFLQVSARAGFWSERLSAPAIEGFQARMGEVPSGTLVDWPLFRQAAQLFQEIVDAKSPFTYEHSLGVARLARALAEQEGMDAERCEMIELAGLLHDIGKLQVPDEILEAPRPLSGRESNDMRAHSFATFDLLREVQGLEEVTAWASSHHEKLDGSGYPFGMTARDLPKEARIVEVADIYQALAQRRPYRGPMEPRAILGELRDMAREGRIDGDLVEVVAAHPAEFHRAAVGSGAGAFSSPANAPTGWPSPR